MAQLSSEERIRRVELAPVEIQSRVAKAFLREDIDDEDIQYLFNTDSIEELNENGLEGVENINAAEPEGIGAENFSMRTAKPGAGNKNYITKGSGGWSTCIKGYPTDSECNVLANCVGYASGRFNEIINDLLAKTGCTYTTLNCNAENFIERAEAAGLKTGSTPKVGAIMCWMKGSTLKSGDGAGHVAVVERVDNDNQVYTSESGYGSKAFWNQTRTNSNGRWGMSASYTFRAFIYVPDEVQVLIDGNNTPEPEPEPTPVTYKFNIGDTVVINGSLYASSDATTPAGSVSNKTTTITRRADGATHPYNTTGDLGWMDESSISTYVAPEPTPVVDNSLKVGDTVKIIGTGNGSCYGTSNTAYGIGWTRKILKIWSGKKFPYQVGNSTGTTGFYEESALEKK